jgi:hypothetical protein
MPDYTFAFNRLFQRGEDNHLAFPSVEQMVLFLGVQSDG